MLVPKRKIPSVATASLVLGGTAASSGCGDDGASTGSVANKACKAFKKCDPEYFSEYYDSLAQCRADLKEYLDYYADYYAEEYGPQCAKALLQYYECIVDEYLRSCAEYAYEECYAEYENLYDACY